jgi:hypothetical protein
LLTDYTLGPGWLSDLVILMYAGMVMLGDPHEILYGARTRCRSTESLNDLMSTANDGTEVIL